MERSRSLGTHEGVARAADQAVSRAARGGKALRSDGRKTLEVILDAAVRVVGTQGSGSITFRSVATAAGVSLGSMTYYFSDREDLLRRTMEFAMGREYERLQGILDQYSGEVGVDSAVDALTEMFFDKTIAEPLYDLALFEMFLEATRSPSLRDLTIAWSEMIARMVDGVLPRTAGTMERDEVIQIVAALVDGLMLESASNQSLNLEDLSRLLRLTVAPLIA